MKRELFKGFAINAVDAKGRLSIPAGYRSTIEARSAVKEVTLSLRFEPNHIRAYDEFYNDFVYQQIERRFHLLTDTDAAAVAAYLKSIPAIEHDPYAD